MLLPKKSSDLYKETAKKCDISEKLVEDLINFYWKEVRRILSNCEADNVIISNLGTFKAKSWKINEILEKHQNILNKYKTNIENGEKISFYKFSIAKDVEENMNKILHLQELINKNESKKQSIKQKRYDQKNKNNLEK